MEWRSFSILKASARSTANPEPSRRARRSDCSAAGVPGVGSGLRKTYCRCEITDCRDVGGIANAGVRNAALNLRIGIGHSQKTTESWKPRLATWRGDASDRRPVKPASWKAAYSAGLSQGARDRAVPESRAGRRLP